MAVVVSRPRFCKGRCVKSNEPCRIDWELDALGYCKYHTPMALQCRGLARSTGQRCRINWDLNDAVLCKYHHWQHVQCHGMSSSGGRCPRSINVNRHGFCPAHPARAEDLLRDLARMTLSALTQTPPTTALAQSGGVQIPLDSASLTRGERRTSALQYHRRMVLAVTHDVQLQVDGLLLSTQRPLQKRGRETTTVMANDDSVRHSREAAS